MKKNENEKELVDKMEKYLSKYFEIYREIWDISHKFRIDIIAIHKTDKDKKFPVGIECKIDAKKTGRDLAAWIKQSQNYSLLSFFDFGKLLILAAPQIQILYLREGTEMTNHENHSYIFHNNVSTFLGQFNIGEVLKSENDKGKYLIFAFKGMKIWDSQSNFFNTENYLKSCR